MKIRIKRVVLGTILGIVIVGIVAIIVWLATPYKASENALKLLSSTDTYEFNNTGNLEFIPKESKQVGVIFYPGGRVEAASYAYFCAAIAIKGYPCIIAVMPLNLAVTKINAADEIINKYTNVEKWVLAGHSLGGSMAARYAIDHNNKVKGLILLGSYSDVNLVDLDIQISTFIASEDTILNSQTFTENYKNLPEKRSLNLIQGGNHSQFGDYGFQDGDGQPKISLEEQHKYIIEKSLELVIAVVN